MGKDSKYKSDAFEAIHSAASGMCRAGTIDKKTMRRFDAACRAPQVQTLGPGKQTQLSRRPRVR